jgi:D-arabinose 1-dehydrogenase-like Zn-dependent alcohol dehydrogenase
MGETRSRTFATNATSRGHEPRRRGSGVSELELEDRVGIGWQGRCCGRCAWCARGEEQLCYEIGNVATWERHGGFASSVTVDARGIGREPRNAG